MRDHLTSIFRSDRELLRYLRGAAVPRGGSLAIIAGHFTLALQESAGRLVPMIWQEAETPGDARRFRERAGDFPLHTFKLGARLLHHCAVGSSAEAHILLLVNDHGFSDRPSSAPPGETVEGRAGRLRHDFYRNSGAVPESFLAILSAEGLTPRDALLPHDDLLRSPLDLLPRESVFFSEQLLREKFDRDIRPGLQENPRILRFIEAAGEIATRGLAGKSPCAFAAEVVQLILDMAQRDVTDIVFFVTDASAPLAAFAVDLAHHLVGPRLGGCPVVHLVTDEGGPIMVLTHAA